MAYHYRSSLRGQLKVNDPKDIQKDMCLFTYVIELPGVKEEDVKIRVTEGRFLIIEAHGCKELLGKKHAETVSPLEADSERILKKFQQEMEELNRESKERNEEFRRELKRDSQERIEQLKRESKERTEEFKRESQERIEKLNRESLERIEKMKRS